MLPNALELGCEKNMEARHGVCTWTPFGEATPKQPLLGLQVIPVGPVSTDMACCSPDLPSSTKWYCKANAQKERTRPEPAPREERGEEERRKTREEEKGGTRKKRKPPPRHPHHPKTLRRSLPDMANTVRQDHRDNSTRWHQNKIRVLSTKPSEHKPYEK